MGLVNNLIAALFGTKASRDMKELLPILDKIKSAYPQYTTLSHDELRQRVDGLKAQIRAYTADDEQRLAHLKEQMEADGVSYDDKEKFASEAEKLAKHIDARTEEVLNQVLKFKSGSILARLGTNMVSLFIVFGLLYWVGLARLIRGQILSIKEHEYVLAARAIGAKPGRIIRKHILPNCISVIIISPALQIPSAIFTESFLSFVGIGVKAPMPSLGSLANKAREGIQSYPYKLVFPAVMICLIVLSLNLIGDGLRDAFDPKLKR